MEQSRTKRVSAAEVKSAPTKTRSCMIFFDGCRKALRTERSPAAGPIDSLLLSGASRLMSQKQVWLGGELGRTSLRGHRVTASWALLEHGPDPSLINLNRHRSLQKCYRQ